MGSNQKAYPSIAQSWGILGIGILSMLVFSPINEALKEPFGKEFAMFAYYVSCMSAPLLFAYFLRKKETGLMGFNFSLPRINIVLITLLAMLGILFSISAPIASSLPMPDSIKQIFLELGKQNGVFGFLTIVLAAPILEEIIFRGIILDGLLKRYSPVKSILVSAFLFGIIHLNPWQFISAMIIGCFSGWIYYRTQKLSLCILIHLVNNLTAFIGMQLMPAEEMMDQSFVELYGGKLNAVIIIVVGLLIASWAIWNLNKILPQFLQPKSEKEVD